MFDLNKPSTDSADDSIVSTLIIIIALFVVAVIGLSCFIFIQIRNKMNKLATDQSSVVNAETQINKRRKPRKVNSISMVNQQEKTMNADTQQTAQSEDNAQDPEIVDGV